MHVVAQGSEGPLPGGLECLCAPPEHEGQCTELSAAGDMLV